MVDFFEEAEDVVSLVSLRSYRDRVLDSLERVVWDVFEGSKHLDRVQAVDLAFGVVIDRFPCSEPDADRMILALDEMYSDWKEIEVYG